MSCPILTNLSYELNNLVKVVNNFNYDYYYKLSILTNWLEYIWLFIKIVSIFNLRQLYKVILSNLGKIKILLKTIFTIDT